MVVGAAGRSLDNLVLLRFRVVGRLRWARWLRWAHRSGTELGAPWWSVARFARRHQREGSAVCPAVSGTGAKVRRSVCPEWGGFTVGVSVCFCRWHARPLFDRFGGHRRVWVRAIGMRPPSAAPSLDRVAAVRLGQGHHGDLPGVVPGPSWSPTRGHAFWPPRVDRPGHDETVATEAIVLTAWRAASPREVIPPDRLGATRGGWEGGVRGDRPHETIHQIMAKGALNAYWSPTMWTIAQGMAPLYPQLQRSHTFTGHPR